MSVFEALALIFCILLVVWSIVGGMVFILVLVERKKAVKEFEGRTGRKFFK